MEVIALRLRLLYKENVKSINKSFSTLTSIKTHIFVQFFHGVRQSQQAFAPLEEKEKRQTSIVASANMSHFDEERALPFLFLRGWIHIEDAVVSVTRNFTLIMNQLSQVSFNFFLEPTESSTKDKVTKRISLSRSIKNGQKAIIGTQSAYILLN